MALTFAALKTEIQNDPNGYGYAQHVATGADSLIAEMLNLVRTGSNGGAEILVGRPDITPSELLEAIDPRDFNPTPNNFANMTLTGSWLESVLQFPSIPLLRADGTNNLIRGTLNRLLADGFGSQARLNALSKRQGSRAEQLFGFGTSITPDHIARALRG